jgi:predicted metalloprotease with PDZ domain
VGLSLERSPRSEGAPCSLGLRVKADGGRAFVASVTRDSAAARAGIDAGDEVLGVGGLRVEGANVEATLKERAPGDTLEVVVSRDGKLLSRRVTLDPPRGERVKLVARKDASAAARAAFESWLGETHPAWAASPREAP